MAQWSKITGSREIMRVFGVPILVHWSVIIGGVLPALFVGFRSQQFVFFCLGYYILIAIHELGHALAARTCGLEVLAIEITGLGGMCWSESPATTKSALILCSGGLLAQIALFAVTLPIIFIFGKTSSIFLNCLILVFTLFNAIIFVGNLAPTRSPRPTDGYEILRIVKQIRRGHA